ncbi:MAG: VWA domain-containing protein [Acidobacteriota bacterium]|nr:VWA domain-containing protein [Acidobacteriota bacterium]
MLLGQAGHSPAQGSSAASAPQQNTPASAPDAPIPDAPIPDAPRPQAVPVGPVTPGAGTTPDSAGENSTSQDAGVPGKLPETAAQKVEDGTPPEDVAAGQGPQYVIRTGVNFVEVPFTVKDNKGHLVAGLTWRDVRVYENNLRQKLSLFTVDPFPLSVALVIDQSMTYDNMTKVNNSLAALQGAFTPYDEVAVFTYNNGPRMQTDFTGAQSARLTAVLDRSKTTGRDPVYYDTSGPLGQNISINGGADSHTDPNTNATHGTSILGIQNVPRDVHTLNDAILAAATSLSKTAKGRRRIVYVISDGREYGSQAKFSQVVKYLNTNKVSIYGTLVGDSSLPVVGFLDRIHLPLMMRDNILAAYVKQTGGDLDGEFRQKGIETSFAKIAEEVRTQYTVGYYTHEPFIDGKYRTLEVKVLRPSLQVYAKPGYYPTASDITPNVVNPAR